LYTEVHPPLAGLLLLWSKPLAGSSTDPSGWPTASNHAYASRALLVLMSDEEDPNGC